MASTRKPLALVPMTPVLRFIGVASALGAPVAGAAAGVASGAAALRDMGIAAAARRAGMDSGWGASIEAPQGAGMTALGALLEEIAREVAATVDGGQLPVVLGGDHAMAAGTWRGVGRALGQAPGLLWIDAHLDAHTPQTSLSQNTPQTSLSQNAHGMPLAALLGSGLLTLGELRRRFPFELLVVIGSALAIAGVVERSGAAELVAGWMRAIFDGHGVHAALAGVYLITLTLTEVITNTAAAALAFPIALGTARAFGVDPMPFVMVVAYGASAGFLIPFGYQTHLMVYSAGRYRMRDFLRAGLPVSLTYSALVLLLVPLVFPLHR